MTELATVKADRVALIRTLHLLTNGRPLLILDHYVNEADRQAIKRSVELLSVAYPAEKAS